MQDVWEMSSLERRYSVPPSTLGDPLGRANPVEDLHAWSIYRQNLNSGFTDSALGSSEKSSPPYGNFRLRESTVHSIMSHPKYGPNRLTGSTNDLGTNMYSYLKFGLPRVFPPSLAPASAPAAVPSSTATFLRTTREASSGYDSSDEGAGAGIRGAGGSRASRSSPAASMHRCSRFRRSRSDPDFRSELERKSTAMPAAQASPGSNIQSHLEESELSSSYWRERRAKSNSEVNLMHRAIVGGGRTDRSDLSGSFVPHYYHGSQNHHYHPHRAMSPVEKRSRSGSVKAGSQMSVLSQTTRSSRTNIGGFHAIALAQAQAGAAARAAAADLHYQLLNEKFFPKDDYFTTLLNDVEGGSILKHPHLQVRSLSYELERRDATGRKDRFRILDGICFEVHGGEMMAVLATDEEEGTALLDALFNKPRLPGSKVRSDLVVNGLEVTADKLTDRMAYVQQDCTYTADMSVRQTLLFTSLLKEPGNPSRGFDTKGRVNALIEDLGLGLVKHTRVKHLTVSEKRRMNVACHLLLDTDILLLDQPTKGMDIFDTFFLVEYLRQWAARGRVVILTIHPPTYEIFTMMSKITLMSCGRMMYFGKRREMLPYFAFIEFPCPAYKNPSDYYLDLVTLDNLSAEAMLESSERIKLLAENFRRRQEPLQSPGPPGIPPPRVKRSNMLVQILALWIRAMIYMFPYNLITVVRNVVIVALMSVLIGAIYQGVRGGIEQGDIQDRFGFHYVMMAVANWPLLLLTTSEVWAAKDSVARDIEDELYTKGAYIICKTTYSFLTAGSVFLAYIVPAYCMSGLKSEDNNQTFSAYLGYMLLYLFAIRTMMLALAYTFDSRHLAASISAFVFTFVVTCSGYTVHFLDLSIILFWFKWVSPMRWMMERLYIWEFPHVDADSNRLAFACSKNPIVAQNGTILVKAPCGFQNGGQALWFMGYDDSWPTYVPILITLAFWAFWQMWIVVIFLSRRQRRKKSANRLHRDDF